MFLTCWFWDNNHLQPFKHKSFIKVFLYISKSLETYFIQNYFHSNPKNTNKTKTKTKTGKIFDLKPDSLIEKY